MSLHNEFAQWDYSAKDSLRFSTLSHQTFETYQVQPELFRNYFQELTGETYSDKTLFLIEYRFLNDYCDGKPNNNWTSEKTKSRVNYTNEQKKQLQKLDNNIVYLVLFEEGITIKKSEENKSYYFIDKENFLRKTIFLNPTLCGSFSIIKSDGLTLVRNGEFNAMMMSEYIKPKNWDSIFKK